LPDAEEGARHSKRALENFNGGGYYRKGLKKGGMEAGAARGTPKVEKKQTEFKGSIDHTKKGGKEDYQEVVTS